MTYRTTLSNKEEILLVEIDQKIKWEDMSIEQRYLQLKPFLDEMFSGNWAEKPERYYPLGYFESPAEIDFSVEAEWVDKIKKSNEPVYYKCYAGDALATTNLKQSFCTLLLQCLLSNGWTLDNPLGEEKPDYWLCHCGYTPSQFDGEIAKWQLAQNRVLRGRKFLVIKIKK